jgi:predicted Zn-dependent protease
MGWLLAILVGLTSLGLPLSLPLVATGQPASDSQLPELQVHPLPPTLAAWNDAGEQPAGDYFDAVQPTELGYLVWSQLPVQVYIQAAESDARSQAWYAAVNQAMQDWIAYLPMTLITDPETADIKILRAAPPMQPLKPSADSPLGLSRIRAAETRYQFFKRQRANSTELIQRFTTYLSPNQTADYTQATARHELGHALGIWGHSPLQTDTLYFSQVSRPTPISARDIRTLRRIYQQPTRLGWAIPVNAAVSAQRATISDGFLFGSPQNSPV